MADRGTQGGMAHSKAEAEEWAKASIRLANGLADDLVAGTMASVVGLGFWVTIAVGTILLLPSALAQGLLRGLTQWLAVSGCCAGVSVITAVMRARRRPVYLTVTRDELICYRVPKMSQQPARAGVLFRASPRTIRVKGREDKKGRNWTIGFASRGLGAKGRPQQHHIRAWLERRRAFQRPLTVDRSWYRELGEVMTALQASGTKVQPALLDITAVLTAAGSPRRG